MLRMQGGTRRGKPARFLRYPPARRPVTALERRHTARIRARARMYSPYPRVWFCTRRRRGTLSLSAGRQPRLQAGSRAVGKWGPCGIAQPAIPRADGFAALERSRAAYIQGHAQGAALLCLWDVYIPGSGQAVQRRLYARPESFRERIDNSPGAISSRYNAAPLSQAAFVSESRWAVPFARANFLCG